MKRLLLLVFLSGNLCAADAQQLPKLPDLQRGQWKMTGQNDLTMCGHPLDSTYREYEQFGDLRKMGCTVDVKTPKDRTVAVAVLCPSDSKMGLVQTSFTLSSPNPQSFSIESSLKGRVKTLNGVRIGNC